MRYKNEPVPLDYELSPRELGRRINIGDRTIRRWVRQRKLDAIDGGGGRLRIRWGDWLAARERMRVRPEPIDATDDSGHEVRAKVAAQLDRERRAGAA